MSTSPLSYSSLVVDICPSVQQHLHNGEMPIPRGPEKGRVPPLHHIDNIDRHGYILLQLLTHIQAIAQGDTGHTEGWCPGHGDGEEQVRLRPMVT